MAEDSVALGTSNGNTGIAYRDSGSGSKHMMLIVNESRDSSVLSKNWGKL